MSSITISKTSNDAVQFEAVERKGIGHPDTLADAVAETLSRYYSIWMHENFGGFAHYWFDKVMIIGGEAEIGYGIGRISRPYRLIVAGKAVLELEGRKVPIQTLAQAAAKDVFARCLVNFDPDKDLEIQVDVRDGRGPGQRSARYRPTDRTQLVAGAQGLKSNDCNLCCGFAPLTSLEQLVLRAEQHLSCVSHRNKHFNGTDVKIVGTRHGSAMHLLVNVPLISSHVQSWEDYLSRIADIQHGLKELLTELGANEVQLTLNPEKARGRPYMTVTGSVADTGDVGVVGRGNRINGLITPMRPMSIEASSGKNSLDHTGKLYGIAAHRAAQEIHRAMNLAVRVFFLSEKEKSLVAATNVHVELCAHSGNEHATLLESQKQTITEIVMRHLENFTDLTHELIFSGVTQW